MVEKDNIYIILKEKVSERLERADAKELKRENCRRWKGKRIAN
jgi:hypothetical protein